jgi:nitroimidazol reductase NimA-like FMN-containing flavoprotein (pyridoxamine 5'-phosphate oxidase superfamily)
MSEKKERPAWFARREISPFTLDDEAADALVQKATYAVVSWVTREAEPVSAVMFYVIIDGKITVTSTTNRAKYHAWRRNPSASFCIWSPDSMLQQVTLRGKVEIVQDADLLRRFTEGFLSRAMGGETPPEEMLLNEIAKFDAPDRHMMQLHVDKVLSHDLQRLLEVEASGDDVW